jgi:hypothetical protein
MPSVWEIAEAGKESDGHHRELRKVDALGIDRLVLGIRHPGQLFDRRYGFAAGCEAVAVPRRESRS